VRRTPGGTLVLVTEFVMLDWGVPEGSAGRGRALALVASCTAALAVAAGLLTAVAGLTFWTGLAAAVFGVLVALGARGWLALRSARARLVPAGQQPRLESLVSGLSEDLGIPAPKLYLVEETGPNAFVCWNAGGAVAVTRGAVDDLNRTELEALVAHCLLRLKRHSVMTATVASFGFLARAVGRVVDVPDDVATASVTRYPPALVSALQEVAPVARPFAAFYFVADGPSHAPVEARIESLTDL
jgi:Zn-dependent protease with chaperone function